MKTRISFLALALLALPLGTSAQEHFKHLLRRIQSLDGIEVSKSTYMERDDENGNSINDVVEDTEILDIRVPYFEWGIFDEIKEAFNEGDRIPTTVYACFNPMEDGVRQQYEIKLKNGSNIRIGQRGNSCYGIAVYPDTVQPRFRTVCAAEWWDTDEKDIKQGRVVYSYGEKPQTNGPLQFHGTAQLSPDGKIIRGLSSLNIPDSIFKVFGPVLEQSFSSFKLDGNAKDISKRMTEMLDSLRMGTTLISSIPLDGKEGLDSWMNKAMNRVRYLSNADWHRLFGLLTQKMIERANKESVEDLVVAAGMVLDLCSNADQLDKDEREVSARRLEDVADHYFDSDKHQYIRDLLMLAKKKLLK